MSVDTVRFLSEKQLIQKALEALLENLGPVETTRFLSLVREERVESVLRHQRWQETLDQDDFFNQVFAESK
jgi:hypothetical protein